MPSSPDPVASPHASFEAHRVQVQDGVSLRVLQWTPREANGADPLVLVAGWVSVVEGWAPLLAALVGERPVLYVESREKHTAQVAPHRMRPSEFAIPRLAEDLLEVWSAFRVDPDRAVVMASSMGSNAVLEALKGGRLGARCAFLIGPNGSFRIPWWGRGIMSLPACGYHLVKPFVRWYLRTYRVNCRADPEQMRRYDRTLDAADPKRLKLSAWALLGYRVWPGLDTIEIPVAIASAVTDTLHPPEEIQRIARQIPSGRVVECPSSTYMHSPALAPDLERFVAEVGGR